MSFCKGIPFQMPIFSEVNLEIWFYAMESSFHTHGITEDLKKYGYTIIALLSSKIPHIKETLMKMWPKVNTYDCLKTEIIKLFPDKSVEKANIYKPSRLLGQLCGLKMFHEKFEKILRKLWIEQLTRQSQCYNILSLFEKQNLCFVALIADKVFEYLPPQSVTDANPSELIKIADNKIAILEKKCIELERELKLKQDIVKKLPMLSQNVKQELEKKDDNKTKINNISCNSDSSTECMDSSKEGNDEKTYLQTRTKGYDRFHGFRRQYKNSRNQDYQRNVCVYHKKFADRSIKCVKPCSFNQLKRFRKH